MKKTLAVCDIKAGLDLEYWVLKSEGLPVVHEGSQLVRVDGSGNRHQFRADWNYIGRIIKRLDISVYRKAKKSETDVDVPKCSAGIPAEKANGENFEYFAYAKDDPNDPLEAVQRLLVERRYGRFIEVGRDDA